MKLYYKLNLNIYKISTMAHKYNPSMQKVARGSQQLKPSLAYRVRPPPPTHTHTNSHKHSNKDRWTDGRTETGGEGQNIY